MCGIVGYLGNRKAIPVIMQGLKSLEYRGYDSSGIAYVQDQMIHVLKKEGKIENLDTLLDYDTDTYLGIAHTRWATHGKANDINAHPHTSGKITLVHNGIIENYAQLKKKLIEKGKTFVSETDTEVVACLLDTLYEETKDLLKAIALLSEKVIGSYALNILCEDELDTLYAVRKDSPLIVGRGNQEFILASDIPALLPVTNHYYLLDNYEIVKITKEGISFYDQKLNKITKVEQEYTGDLEVSSKKGYDHFMLKEINEQPEVIKNLLAKYVVEDHLQNVFDIKKYQTIEIVACGSAYHAGLIGKYYLENLASIPTRVTYSSEYRYQKNFFDKNNLVIVISQSGETADTLAALKLAKEHGIDTLAIVNVVSSSIAREADHVFYTDAGIEVAVATTKAYFAQVVSLLLLAVATLKEQASILASLKQLPSLISKYIHHFDYETLAKRFIGREHIFYLGRGVDFSLAMEGSLKLKEISYIHSEAYPAGELKHGTISLVDEETGIIAVVLDHTIKEKTISNLKEVASRGAQVVAITNDATDEFCDEKILLEDYDAVINPLVAIIPMQLLAYHVAKLKKCDIDKPRNLAKSVTVE